MNRYGQVNFAVTGFCALSAFLAVVTGEPVVLVIQVVLAAINWHIGREILQREIARADG